MSASMMIHLDRGETVNAEIKGHSDGSRYIALRLGGDGTLFIHEHQTPDKYDRWDDLLVLTADSPEPVSTTKERQH